MEIQLLRDPDIFPSEKELQKALGIHFEIYRQFMREIAEPHYGLEHEWRYYHDGKAWLCKLQYKRKTVLWLSVWDGYFKTAFYFTERHAAGIETLPVDATILQDFKKTMPVGKLKPLVLNVIRQEKLADVLKLIQFKKSLK